MPVTAGARHWLLAMTLRQATSRTHSYEHHARRLIRYWRIRGSSYRYDELALPTAKTERIEVQRKKRITKGVCLRKRGIGCNSGVAKRAPAKKTPEADGKLLK